MSGKDEEVAVEVLNVDAEVWYALCAVNQEVRSGIVCHSCHVANGIDRSEDVADVAAAHKSGFRSEQTVVGFHVKVAGIVHRHHFQGDSVAFAYQLPWDDVAVVFHDGKHHLVAGFQECLGIGRGDEIQTFRRSACEDHLCRTAGIDEGTYLFAGRLVQVGGTL